ncbi:hypothetical protein CK5_23370 [Blautia obeum A2-162]|uniref:Uncharacterized protein n=1 Tax=Blautia obeum A2-162 TaxID=657314 RepID=D4LSB0_9FIRM|nr:hypothetical protein CK5_23370 [Blautia obeum A2-162]
MVDYNSIQDRKRTVEQKRFCFHGSFAYG